MSPRFLIVEKSIITRNRRSTLVRVLASDSDCYRYLYNLLIHTPSALLLILLSSLPLLFGPAPLSTPRCVHPHRSSAWSTCPAHPGSTTRSPPLLRSCSPTSQLAESRLCVGVDLCVSLRPRCTRMLLKVLHQGSTTGVFWYPCRVLSELR